MKAELATARLVTLTLALIGSLGNLTWAQGGTAQYSRQSDVIYGRRAGLALTMEVFTPIRRNGLSRVGSEQ